MKYLVSVLLVLVLATGVACAQANTWRLDFDGNTALTPDHYVDQAPWSNGAGQGNLGWTNCQNAGDPVTKGKDMSWGEGGDGTNGLLKIYDANPGGNTYMRTYYNPGLSSSVGLAICKIKSWGASASVKTNFGFSIDSSGVGAGLGIRNGAVIVKGAGGDDVYGGSAAVDTSVWRVYALKWDLAGFTAWYSNTNEWSSNQADWVQIASYGYAANSGFKDTSGVFQRGLVLGNLSGSGETCNLSIDYISTSKNSEYIDPWTFDPVNEPVIPEPGSMLALASGLVGMAGFAIRRRRA